jgi:hypothetical protein
LAWRLWQEFNPEQSMHEIPKLQFVPVTSLLRHERHDDERTRPLILRIQSSGIFRNPPIVSPLQDGSGPRN